MWTMGPSRPAEPPVPMVTAAVRPLKKAALVRILPPNRITESITSGTPWAFASRAPHHTSGPTIRPPIAGTIAYHILSSQDMERSSSGSAKATAKIQAMR